MSKPIAFFDTETTGVDLENDRIVSISITIMSRDLRSKLDSRYVLINPTIPIPKEASDIHGITDELVKDKPVFAQYARGMAQFLAGCDLAGFHILGFDVPLLGEEFERCGISWPEPGTIFLDACRIYHEKEKRDLTAAVKFYLGREIEGAHTADGDVESTIDVFRRQLEFYPDLTGMTMEQVADFCMPEKFVDLAGKIVLNEQGVPVFSFGKNKGDAVKESLSYATWMLKGNFPINTKKAIHKILGWGPYKPKAVK